MSAPHPWKDHECTFRATLDKASSKLEANLYVHECLMYFYKAGYREDDIERTEILMKKAVQNWAHSKYNVGSRSMDLPKLETTGDFFEIRYFDPLLTYTLEMVGSDAAWVQHRLRKYRDDVVSKRQDPGKGRIPSLKMTLVDSK
jgi:hypothetical protein